MSHYRWFVYALLGALCAAVVNLLTKKALAKADPVLATTLQSIVMLLTLSLLTTATGRWTKMAELSTPTLALIGLAGAAAGLAWFFGYQALALTTVSRATTVDRFSLVFAVLLAVLFLGERPSGLNWAGVAMMLIGAICVAQSNGH